MFPTFYVFPSCGIPLVRILFSDTRVPRQHMGTVPQIAPKRFVRRWKWLLLFLSWLYFVPSWKIFLLILRSTWWICSWLLHVSHRHRFALLKRPMKTIIKACVGETLAASRNFLQVARVQPRRVLVTTRKMRKRDPKIKRKANKEKTTSSKTRKRKNEH